MKVGILSDVHGNLAALEVVLSALDREGSDRVVCLGDVAATGPQPCEVLARVRELDCPVVMGNTDAFLLDPRPGGGTDSDDEDARKIEEIDLWCAGQLAPEDREFLRTFRPTVEVPLAGGVGLLCYHGSPRSYDDVIMADTPSGELDAMLEGHAGALFAGGHWHFQMLRRHRHTTLVNPGSVGLAYEVLPGGAVRVAPWAEYAVVALEEVGALEVGLRRVPYDSAATVRAMSERGMPHAGWWAADWA